MKPIILYTLLLSSVAMHAQNVLHTPPEHSFVFTIKSSFPEGFTFIHHEPDETVPADTLSYGFHLPEVEIKSDTLFLAYVQKTREHNGSISVELVKQTIPINCIEEIKTFNFTFGATDRFEPPLSYLGFWMKDDSCLKTETFALPEDRWEDYKQFKMTRISQDSWHVARFPAMLTPKTMRMLEKDLKTLHNSTNNASGH